MIPSDIVPFPAPTGRDMLKATSEILQRSGLTGPTVVLDRDRAQANLFRMINKARAGGAVFRPHFKTHQSAAVGAWFAAAGVRRITVSSLAMAETFAAQGWHDITVALLHNPLETERAERLAARLDDRGGRLGLLVDDTMVAAALARDMHTRVAVWLKTDTGYGRTGIRWDDAPRLRAVLAACRGPAAPVGLLTHSGHSYAARGGDQIAAIFSESVVRMRAARARCGAEDLLLSLGDTPCCSVVDDLSACDEIRPGNFIFYDLMQLQIGSCAATDLAAAIACPVVGVYPERRQLVLQGGAVHLSKESLVGAGGVTRFGCLGTVTDVGLGGVLPQAPLVSLSQEHGVVEIRDDWQQLAAKLVPGDLVLVWPVHSCLSCDLLHDQMSDPVTL